MPFGVYDILAKIGLDYSNFETGTEKVKSSAQKTAQQLDKTLNVSLVAITTAIGASVAAAIQFESSFAGVTKTVDGLRDPMGRLNTEGEKLAAAFRALALEVPVSVNELNKIGELGGQLGIAKEDLIKFTGVIAQMGVTTNLTTEAAATGMARFVNVTKNVAPAGKTASEQIERIGSTVVALGNSMATTESEILEFGLRIAGAGTQVGLAQADILAFSAAFSSVGINAEAGGTAFSRVISDMASSVKTGGKKFEKFAEVAEMSADDFAKAFNEDPKAAILAFITGLGNISRKGENAFGTLDELELSEIRVRNAMLLAGGASDIFTEALIKGNNAYVDNNALSKEAAQRFGTVESQLVLVKNAFYDAFITLGNEFLPAIRGVLDVIKAYPAEITAFVTAAGKIAALAGGIIVVTKAIGGLKTAFTLLNKATGPVGLAITAVAVAIPLLQAAYESFKNVHEDEIKNTGDEIQKLKDLKEKVEELSGKKGDSIVVAQDLKRAEDELRAVLLEQGIVIGEGSKAVAEAAQKQIDLTKTGLEQKIKDLNSQLETYTQLWLDSNEAKDPDQEKLYADKIKELNEEIKKQKLALQNVNDVLDGKKTKTDEVKTSIENLTTAVNESVESTKDVIDVEGILNEASIKTTKQIEAEITKWEAVLPRLQDSSVEYKKVKDILSELYTTMGDDASWIKLNTGVDASELAFKGYETVVGEIRGKHEELIPTVISLTDTQGKLSDAGITTTHSIKGFSDKLGLSKQNVSAMIGGVAGLAQEFGGLGPTASGAVDLLASGLQGLLTGSLDPVSLGFKAAGLVIGAFTQEEEKVVLTTEEAYTELGFLGKEVKNVTEYMNKFNKSIDSTLINEATSALESWTEHFKNTQDAFASERIEYWTKKLEELIGAFKLTDELDAAKEAIGSLIEKGIQMVDEFGGWEFPGMEGFAKLLAEQITSSELLLLQLDPMSAAYKKLAAQVETAKEMYDKLIGSSTELTGALFNEVTGYTDVSNANNAVYDSMKALALAHTDYLDSAATRNTKINETIEALKKENEQLDIGSQQYKDNEDKILQLNYAMASLNGYSENFYTWLKENGLQLNSVNDALETNREKADASGGAFHVLAEKVRIATEQFGGLTGSLVDEIEESIDGLAEMAQNAIDMKARYGDIEFPDMSAQLEKAIADNQALLATLDPNSAAYAELQANIDKAKLAMALISGEVETANEWYAEQIKVVGTAGATFDEKAAKMQTYLDTIVDTKAPLDEQLAQLQEIQGNMVVGSAEYVFMAGVIEELKAKMEELNGTTEHTNEYYAEEIKLVGMAGATYDEKAAKMQAYLDTIIDTQSPLDEQLAQLEDIQSSMVEGSAEYVFMAGVIEALKAKMEELTESTEAQTAANEAASASAQTFAGYMAEQKNAILASMDAFAGLFEAFQLNQEYFGGMADPALQQSFIQWLATATNQLHDMKEAGMENSQAYKDLSDKINLAKAAAAVMAGEYATIEEYLAANNITLYSNTAAAEAAQQQYESLTDALADAQNKLKDLENRKVELEAKFQIDRMNIENEILAVHDQIQDVMARKEALKMQFEIDKANLEDKASQLRALMEQMDAGAPVNLYEVNKLIEELSGNTRRLTIEWGDMVGSMIQEYSGFEQDLETATQALQTITDFNIDLDATQADEQINSLIFSMQGYLATLDPDSPKYKEMQEKLNQLMEQFIAAGGVIDEEMAQESTQEYAEQGVQTLQEQLAALMAQYQDADMQLNLELEGLYDDLEQLNKDLNDLINNYNNEKINIELEMSVLTETIQHLLEQIAAAGGGTTGGGEQQTGGGEEEETGGGGGEEMHYGGIVQAHSGLLANDEEMAILKNKEVVIPEPISSRFSEIDWRNFIASGSAKFLGNENPPPIMNNVEVNIQAIVHQDENGTWLEFKEMVDKWDRDKNKNKTEVTIFQ